MTKIFTKLRSLVDDALNERSPIIEQDTTLMAAPVERELFDHRILYIEEDMVNRMLRAAFRNHWLIYSVTFEFEPNNQVFLSIITKWGNVINVEFTIEDVWFDDYSSSFAIKLDTANIDTGGFILNSILHLLGNWCLSLFGIFFNPIAIGRLGSTVRFEKKGILQFDLVPNSRIKKFIPLPERHVGSTGPVLLGNPKTGQSVLQLDYYAFHDPVDTFTVPDVPTRTSWVKSIDIAAVLLLPIGVWITFIILHHYLPTETLEFSFSTYFLISLGIFIISFLVMNIPRYVYMYVDSRKQWQSAFVHNNIKIQLRKLHRRIFMQQASLSTDCDECVASQSQERIKQLLLQIRDKRFLANRLKIADDDRARKQKVKFIIAYIGCTLIELMLLMN
ncbi:hypothetical protein [Veillonella atypica]|uniref:Uncharacterized protein n=1 Tax=Veillonella atypica KON TaxID=1128111 RepID=A0ABP2SRL1_9FIRM|nr:hypothetical protein [Veillonella atypica]EKY19014.1 hypothetical protein HMPREF0870_01299 [Veillonella atypica KON]